MKKNYFSLFIILIFLTIGNGAFAQLTGGQIYLPGHWLEIGQNAYGAFGANPPPAGYHPYPAGTDLAEVYDYGHDGWTTGAPPLMGDYTYPGSPFEGWGIQVGGTSGLNWAFTSNGAITGTGSLTGSNTSYVNAGGKLLGNWTGTTAGGQLRINMETRVDTNASWVVVTAKLYNTGATTLNNLYYFRSCDPDNDEAHGGSFATTNTITFQNDGDHRVGVSGVGETYTYAYLQLCTKDCRAKSLIYSYWPIDYYVTDLSTVYTGTAAIVPYYTAHGTDNGDIAIGLIYQLGGLCGGDSTFVSYAYTFLNTANGIDSAFPEPNIVVNGTPAHPPAAPGAIYDTFNTCLYPGLATLPVSLTGAATGAWTWSTWTWSPGTGLSSTTGLTNNINVAALPPSITYTITGTAYNPACAASAGGDCGTRVIYLTVMACNSATVNSPCYGDTLKFNAPGDSTGATYVWYGPAPATTIVGTTQSFSISPAVWADTGTYHVVKTIGGVHDTSVTTAVIHPKPNVMATSNSPLCAGTANTLTLFSSTDIAVTTYGWTGPAGFTSAIQNPTIPGFTAPDTGIYTIMVATAYGCKDTATTHVVLLPPPMPPTVTDPNPYCQGDAFIPFTITGATGTVYWYPTATGGTATTVTPTVNTAVAGTYTYYFGQTVGTCVSPEDSIKVVVNPSPSAITGPADVCQYFTITLADASTGGSWSSSNTAVATISSAGVVSGLTAGTTMITYKQPTGCHVTKLVNVHAKPAKPVVTPPTYCQFTLSDPLTATPTTGLLWYGPAVTAGTPIAPVPSTLAAGTFNYYVTETSSFGCVSDSTIDPVTIITQPTPPVTRDSSYCQFSPTATLNLQVDSAYGSHLTWYTATSGGTALGGAPLPPNNVVTYPAGTTWYVSQTVDGCESNRAPITVTIVYLPNFKIHASNTWVCDHDTLSFAYSSTTPLVSGSYEWLLPPGATPVNGTTTSDPAIVVKFDSVYGPHVIYLTVGELNKMCESTDTISVTVIPPPETHCFMTPNVCLGDTVGLAISDKSPDASIFSWYIDGVPLFNSTELNVIAANSNTGGPFSVSWNDTGIHYITVACVTNEGCRSVPTYDTVDVHSLPDATFTFKPKTNGTLCLEDSVLFIASNTGYNNTYLWQPESYFHNDNKPQIWGKVDAVKSIIMLTVTDPLGCKNSATKEIDPGTCCTILFPSAFTPNGDGKNDKFRPISTGYHRFHSFRVVNRWGQTVFESAGTDPEWDGNFNGVPQDMGVYYYYIKYDCGGTTIEEKGDCTLVR